MGMHDHTKRCFPQYLQSLQKQVKPKPILFLRHSCKQCCKQALKFHGCNAIETIRRAETDPNAPEGNQCCTSVQSHSDHIEGPLHNLAISTGRE